MHQSGMMGSASDNLANFCHRSPIVVQSTTNSISGPKFDDSASIGSDRSACLGWWFKHHADLLLPPTSSDRHQRFFWAG
jgi:hypothetical protein